MSLDQLVGNNVTIEGTARNAAAGAVVLTEDRTPVYVAGLERWDRTLDGKKVSASGTLRREASDELVNAKGEHNSGVGAHFVLEGPSWKLA